MISSLSKWPWLFAFVAIALIETTCSFAQEPKKASCASVYANLTAVALWPVKTAVVLMKEAKEVFQEDYVGAYRSGKTFPEKWKNVAVRSVWAPRSREKDPQIRAEELKLFLWGNAAKSTGVFSEGTNQIKVGLGYQPLENNLSFPADISAALGLGAIVAWKIDRSNAEQWRLVNQELNNGAVGLEYPMEWAEENSLDLQTVVQIFNKHSERMGQWLKDIQDKRIPRRLPPRVYQFQMLNLLQSEKEVHAFEKIIIEAWRAYKDNKEVRGANFLRGNILEALKTNALFKSRDPKSLRLLTLVFDPPFFFDRKSEDFSWVDEIQESPHKAQIQYNNQLSAYSDLQWLYSSLENPKLQSINYAFPDEVSARKATFAYEQAQPQNQQLIEAKANEISKIRDFPANKRYLGTRLDLSSYVNPRVPWVNKFGQPVYLDKESDYWALLCQHPAFALIKTGWKNGKISDLEAITSVRQRVSELSSLFASQEDSIAARRNASGQKLAPFDPSPEESCDLQAERKSNFLPQANALKNEVNQWKREIGTAKYEDFCRYRIFVGLWRFYAMEQEEWRVPTGTSTEEFAVKKAELKKNIHEVCSESGAVYRLRQNLKLDSLEALNRRLHCRDE